MLEVLEASEPPVLQQFQEQFGALQGMHVVAKDCVSSYPYTLYITLYHIYIYMLMYVHLSLYVHTYI